MKIPDKLDGFFLITNILKVIPAEQIVYLGEGHTPLVEANDSLKEMVARRIRMEKGIICFFLFPTVQGLGYRKAEMGGSFIL